MRAVIQRVSQASVAINEASVAKINQGLLILLGIEHDDTVKDVDWLVAKIIKLRIFGDETGAMNLSLIDKDGDAIIVSQFTLHAFTKKGTRPSFLKAAKPDVANPLYRLFIDTFEKELGKQVGTGEFGAMMQVSLINDGPVTIVVDTKNKE